jgi:hypothetical protein
LFRSRSDRGEFRNGPVADPLVQRRTLTIKAPAVPGTCQICVTATDRAGNASEFDCAKLTVSV